MVSALDDKKKTAINSLLTKVEEKKEKLLSYTYSDRILLTGLKPVESMGCRVGCALYTQWGLCINTQRCVDADTGQAATTQAPSVMRMCLTLGTETAKNTHYK